MTITVEAASSTVQLDISGSYDAEQLLELIKELCAARGRIAKDPAKPGEIWLAPRASCHTQLMPTNGPESMLAISFPGLGWIGATMSAVTRAQLIGLLATQQATVASATTALPVVQAVSVKLEPGSGGNTLH